MMFSRIRNRAAVSLLVITIVLSLFPAVTQAAPSFTNKIKSRFVEQIMFFAQWENPYGYYALHDFDDDGIPELLMGRNNRDEDQRFIYYAVWKYDVVGDRFVYIGAIEESRYIMKDNYSNALLAIYADPTGATDCKAYFNYYITDSRLERNTVLTRLTTYGLTSTLVYDTMFIYTGYYRYDIPVDRQTFNEEELNFLGSYEELVVHDWRGFNNETVYIAVNSWKPHVVVKKPKSFSSADRFTKLWQMPMYDLIKEKFGPADTLIEDEWYWEMYLWSMYGQQDYERYALYDLDGDAVPELFLGLRYGDHFSYDVYKWWNGYMRYIGSFDCYSKYLAVVTGSRDIFTFDPVPNEFYRQSAKRIGISDNTLSNVTLLASYIKDGKTQYLAPNSKGDALVSINYDKYLSALTDYAYNYKEIRTFDIRIVPPSAALIMYLKTKGFTEK